MKEKGSSIVDLTGVVEIHCGGFHGPRNRRVEQENRAGCVSGHHMCVKGHVVCNHCGGLQKDCDLHRGFDWLNL